MDLPPLMDAASARLVIGRLADALGAAGLAGMRAPPPEPTTCCGRGCNGCVWEGYLDAVRWWCQDALELLAHAPGGQD